MDIVFTIDEYEFAGVAWIIPALMLLAAVVGYALNTKAERNSEEDENRYRFNRRKYIIWWTVSFSLVFAVLNLFSFWTTQWTDDSRYATLHEVDEQVGIESGKVYPLILGDTYVGIEGSVNAEAGLFTASATIDIKPTAIINIAFQQGKRTWQLQLPSRVTPYEDAPVVDGLEVPAAQLTLKDAILADYQARWVYTWPDCVWELHNFMVVCTRGEPTEILWVSDAFKNQSLPDFVTNYYESGTIYITQQQRQILLPNN